MIRFDLRFNSLRFDNVSIFSILTIWLCERLSILNDVNRDIPYILGILFEWRSSTSSLVNSLIFFILVRLFFAISNTFSVGIATFSISLMRLSWRSRYSKWGKDIRFSIFTTLLCWKVNIFSFSSPSNKGKWLS